MWKLNFISDTEHSHVGTLTATWTELSNGAGEGGMQSISHSRRVDLRSDDKLSFIREARTKLAEEQRKHEVKANLLKPITDALNK